MAWHNNLQAAFTDLKITSLSMHGGWTSSSDGHQEALLGVRGIEFLGTPTVLGRRGLNGAGAKCFRVLVELVERAICWTKHQGLTGHKFPKPGCTKNS